MAAGTRGERGRLLGAGDGGLFLGLGVLRSRETRTSTKRGKDCGGATILQQEHRFTKLKTNIYASTVFCRVWWWKVDGVGRLDNFVNSGFPMND